METSRRVPPTVAEWWPCDYDDASVKRSTLSSSGSDDAPRSFGDRSDESSDEGMRQNGIFAGDGPDHGNRSDESSDDGMRQDGICAVDGATVVGTHSRKPETWWPSR